MLEAQLLEPGHGPLSHPCVNIAQTSHKHGNMLCFPHTFNAANVLGVGDGPLKFLYGTGHAERRLSATKNFFKNLLRLSVLHKSMRVPHASAALALPCRLECARCHRRGSDETTSSPMLSPLSLSDGTLVNIEGSLVRSLNSYHINQRLQRTATARPLNAPRPVFPWPQLPGNEQRGLKAPQVPIPCLAQKSQAFGSQKSRGPHTRQQSDEAFGPVRFCLDWQQRRGEVHLYDLYAM